VKKFGRAATLRTVAIAGAAVLGFGFAAVTQIAGAAEQPAAQAQVASLRVTLPADIREAVRTVTPAGAIPVAAYRAKQGTGDIQTYTCDANGAWPTASTPTASLTRIVGFGPGTISHFGGPRWSAPDGSTVLGTVRTRVPVEGELPWLLIDFTHEVTGGYFDPVTSVSRVLTDGGTAPAGACTPGAKTDVPYDAVYVFWVAI
jgi:hypothetical protein